jgi:hypothetical protein
MSSFYDDASLVVIPSGYKTSKVYAEKPTDGSGDLTFTRTGDTATRVNSAGLIEKVRTNLVTYSEDFANAAWTKNNASVTSNAIANPLNGATTADLITATSNVGYVSSTAFAMAAVPYTISLYVKKSNVDWVSIEASDGVANSSKSWFNLTTGALGTTGGTFTILSRSAEALANGWYRVRLTFSVTSATNYSFVPFFVASDGALSASGNAGYAFGAQVEISDFGATDYIPTTTAAVSVGPVANVPRLDYLGSTCPRLLLEPQRQNLVTFSEQFNNAYWSKFNTTITVNATTSPDGYVNADKFVENTANNFHSMDSNFASGTGVYTASIYAKQAERRYLRLNITEITPAKDHTALFDLQTGTVVNFSTGVTASIQSAANGFYRVIITSPALVGGQVRMATLMQTTTSASPEAYLGNGTSGMFLWGAQLEAGAYATSYIPTLAASATRGADACSKTGISSLIGQTEGTLYWEGSINGIPVDQTIFGVEKEASNFVIRFGADGTNLYAQSYNGSANLFYETTTPSVGQTIKLAFAYKAGSYAFYKNGTLVASGTNASTIPACDKLQTNVLWSGSTGIGAYNTNQALLFKTRLTNSELAELTSL